VDSFAAHVAEGRRLLSLALERMELTDGWALRFPSDDSTVVSLARWIVGERHCCPFFTFSLECQPAPGDLWMRITGPDGAKEVLGEAFAGQPSRTSGP
jgi:hypothetical protein